MSKITIEDKLGRILEDIKKVVRNERRRIMEDNQCEISRLNAEIGQLKMKCWNLESQVRSQCELIEAMDAGMGGAWCRFWAGLFTKGGD